MALIAIPTISLLYSPVLAISLVPIPLVVTNFHQGVIDGDIGESLNSHALLASVMMVVMVTTAYFSNLFAQGFIEWTIGLCAIAFVICNFKLRLPSIPDRFDKIAQMVTGVVAGFIGGITGLIVIPLVAYMMLRNINRERFISVIGLLFLLSGIALLVAQYLNDFLTAKIFFFSAMATVPALLGTLFGESLRNRISEEQFRKLVLLLIFLIGVKTLTQ